MSAIKDRSVSTAFPTISLIRNVETCGCLHAEDVQTYNALHAAANGASAPADAAKVLKALQIMREALDLSADNAVSPDEYDNAVRVLEFLIEFVGLAGKEAQ